MRVWNFMRIPQREFTICTPWIRQVLTTRNEKVWGRKRCVLNNTSQTTLSLSFWFYLPDLLIYLYDLQCDISPHPDLRLVPICLLPFLCNCANREALSIVVAIVECAVKPFLQFQQKHRSKQKCSRTLITNKSSLSKSYRAIPREPHSLTDQLQYHLLEIKITLHVYINSTFITGLKDIKFHALCKCLK